jgi:hypothetical protein
MAGPLDLLIPPRLIVRAADDLHRLVALGERAMGQLERLEDRADRILALGEVIEDQATQIIALGDRIGGQADDILDMGGKIGGQADEIVSLGGRIDGRGAEITELGARLEELGRQMLAQGEVISERADAVATRAGDLVDALPTIEQAVTMVSPLEGAVERLGRTIDRFPGGRSKGRRHEVEDQHSETDGPADTGGPPAA